MIRRLTLLVLSVSAIALSGCATFIDGKPDKTGKVKGLRYALPAPFLMVTPKPDGTLDVQVVNLPDPDNTYTLTTKSLVSAYTLDVQLDHQMLKSVTMNPKSDAVAAAAIDSIGNYKKAQLDQETKTKDDAAKADADAAKALADAKLAVDVAKGKVQTLTDATAGADKITDAKVAENEAEIKYTALKNASTKAGTGLASADAPVASKSGTNGVYAAGPMLFRILPDGKGVKLIAVRGPTVFATATSALPAPAFDPTGTITVTADKDGVFKFDVTYNRPVRGASGAKIYSASAPATPVPNTQPTVLAATDPKGAKLTITLDKGMPAGFYGIYFDLILMDETRVPGHIDINILK